MSLCLALLTVCIVVERHHSTKLGKLCYDNSRRCRIRIRGPGPGLDPMLRFSASVYQHNEAR